MKSLLFAGAVMAAVAATAEETIVKGANDVGMTAVAVAAGQSKVALPVPYKSLSSGGAVVVSNIVKTTNLDKGDNLVIFDQTERKYVGWVIDETEADVKVWKELKDVYLGASGLVVQGQSPSPTDTQVVLGNAVWVFRNGTVDPLPATTIYLYGQYVADPTSTIVAGTTTSPKWNFVANPKGALSSTDFATKLSGLNPSAGDQIWLITATSRVGAWTWNKNKSKWMKLGTTEGPALEAGQAFWYVSKGGGGTINW